MTRQEIQAFFPTVYPIHFGGMNYAVPTTAWLTGSFWDFFKKQLWDFGTETWSVKFECRDFARAYACYAQTCNALSGDTPEGADALAVGEIWFHPDSEPPGSDHAICACVTDKGLVYIEPQTGAIRTLSRIETLSCTFLRF